jgi:hypothetical protein
MPKLNINLTNDRSEIFRSENPQIFLILVVPKSGFFDWENSVYEPHPRLPNRVYSIDKLVLKRTNDNYSPLFRLSAYPSKLFVSGKARMALEHAGIKGVVFEEIENYDLTI